MMAYPTVKSLCFKNSVALTCLIDPAKVQYGSPSATTLKYPVGGAAPAPYKTHNGLDIAASAGTPVLSMYDGKVTEVTSNSIRGKYITVANGRVAATYMHLNSQSVKVGQQVQKGDEIGKEGATGNVTGPHLHVTLKVDGKIADPYDYVMGAKAFPFTSDEEELPPVQQIVYTVKSGDTLSKIASRFSVTLEQVLYINPQIVDPNLIRVGDAIYIPREAGDVDMDGTVDAEDARVVLRAALGKLTLAQAQALLADINADGKVDSADARLILRKALGK